jgi:hypothetical protein
VEDVTRLRAELQDQFRAEFQDQDRKLDDLGRKLDNLPENSLPRRAVQLGKEITAFLEQRDKSRPAFQPSEKDPPGSRRQEAEFYQYLGETLNDFATKFGSRCRGIAKEFEARGESSSTLNRACQAPKASDWVAVTIVPRELIRIVKELH